MPTLNDVTEIICDSQDGQRRAQEYLQGWAGKQTRVTAHSGDESLLVSRGVDREIEAASVRPRRNYQAADT